MAKLSKDRLLGKLLEGLRDGGWTPLVLDQSHPFQIRAVGTDRQPFTLRAYIWNCTHGGGGRAGDEFRIQFTSVVPQAHVGEITVLLGWHDDTGVFAAWDIVAHDGQATASPSAQIKLATLEAAREKAFATQAKGNEIVAAFRPIFISEYALSAATLHRTGQAQTDFQLLNQLDDVTDEQIEEINNAERRTVIRTIASRYRAANFRDRVLTAYRHRCAFCGVQLSLLDAAHIVPVFASGSTDEINNGVALCKLHHFAYDSNLVSFNENYLIELSSQRVVDLRGRGEAGGLKEFKSNMFETVALPERALAQPTAQIIRTSRRIRRWQA
jgi:putative restriction endonuclease